MSDTETQTHIIALRLRERDLELEACSVRARIEEIRSMLEMLEHPRRQRGRPRKENILELPERAAGAVAQPEPDTAA
jgi:hypothetical protein